MKRIFEGSWGRAVGTLGAVALLVLFLGLLSSGMRQLDGAVGVFPTSSSGSGTYPSSIRGSSLTLTGGVNSYIAIPGTNGNAIVINGQRQDLSYTGSGAAGTNVSVTASNGHAFYLLLTNNAHFTATAMTFGQNLTVAVVQGGIGGYAVSWNTNVLRTNAVDGYTILTNVGGVSYITLVPGPYHTNAAVGVRKGY